MGGHINFRDHLDVTGLGILHNLDVVGTAEIAAAVVIAERTGTELRQQAALFAQVMAALSPHVSQFR